VNCARQPRRLWPNDRSAPAAAASSKATATLNDVGDEIFNLILRIAADAPTVSEMLGHREFSLVYQSFEPLGPACLP
jgi:hypothetical protein